MQGAVEVRPSSPSRQSASAASTVTHVIRLPEPAGHFPYRHRRHHRDAGTGSSER